MCKKNLAFILAITFYLVLINCFAEEITIFDSDGNAQAYIDTSDDDSTIYLWSGIPVAYLDNSSIYGFNGKHLGWLKNKVLYNNDGYIVGFLEGGLDIPTKLEPLKDLKELKPLKSLEELTPIEPVYNVDEWSSVTEEFLLKGSDQ